MTFIKRGSAESQYDINLYFEDHGPRDGRPVVLVHGWPLSGRMWEPQVGPLTEQGYRCITYDRRGFGDSSKPWDGYDYDTMTDDLRALIKGLDLQDVALVGFSMGGGEVARYFGRYGSDRVSQAALVSAVTPYMMETPDNPDGVDVSVFDEMMKNVKEDRIAFLDQFGKDFVNWGLLDHPISEDMLHYFKTIASFASPRATQQCITAFGKTDFRNDLQRIDVPTLIVHGKKDQIVPFEASAEKSAKLIAQNRLEPIDDAPHGLFATHTEAFNRILLNFLGDR